MSGLTKQCATCCAVKPRTEFRGHRSSADRLGRECYDCRLGGPSALAARFWVRVAIADPAACWLWTGGMSNTGYGIIRVRGRSVGTHRIAWEIANGCAVPPGLEVLHACDNKRCVNPAHLSVGTHAQNMSEAGARGLLARCGGSSRAAAFQRAKTHCPRGHAYEGENLILMGGKWRACRTCDRERRLRDREARLAAKSASEAA